LDFGSFAQSGVGRQGRQRCSGQNGRSEKTTSLYVNQKRRQHIATDRVGQVAQVGQDSLEANTTSRGNCIRRACKHDLALEPPFCLTTRQTSSSSASSQLKCTPFMRREHCEKLYVEYKYNNFEIIFILFCFGNA